MKQSLPVTWKETAVADNAEIFEIWSAVVGDKIRLSQLHNLTKLYKDKQSELN